MAISTGFGPSLRAQNAPPAVPTPAGEGSSLSTPGGALAGAASLPPEAVALPNWEFSQTLRLAGGWKDNVLLSSADEQAKGFLRGEVEGLAWRVPAHGWEALAFLDGAVTRYLNPPAGVGSDQEWFAHGELRWDPQPGLHISGNTQGYYQDQVFDLSATGAERVVARLKVRGALGGVEARMAMPKHVFLSVLGQAHRSDYLDYTEDFSEAKGGVRLAWTPTAAFSVSATVWGRDRRYDDRTQYTAFGRSVAGTRLVFHQREGEFKAEYTKGAWSGSASVLWLENRDGASGYFDYREHRARLDTAWRQGPWTWKIELDAGGYRYAMQTAGFGFNAPLRRRDEASGELRGERAFGDRWLGFAEIHAERSRSNEADVSYEVHTATVGAAFTF